MRAYSSTTLRCGSTETCLIARRAHRATLKCPRRVIMSATTRCSQCSTPRGGRSILNTHSDKIFCPRVTKQPGQMPDEPVDRCNGGCYSTGLNGKKFTGRFRLGPRRVDDVASTQHHLELVLFFPYKHFGATSWSDADERAKSTYVVQSSIPSQVNSWATKKESQDLPDLAHGRAADLERTQFGYA